jgi:hypothetical protein
MLLLLLALIVHSTPGVSQVGSRDAIVKLSTEVFGRRVEDSPVLFEVNHFYVLRVQFGRDDRLEQAAIEPRFYYADTHPGWEEPDNFKWLTTDRVAEMLAKLDRLRSLGKLVRPFSGVVYVTNLTGPQTDEYEKATVIRGEVSDIRRPADAPVLVRYITVRYKPSL